MPCDLTALMELRRTIDFFSLFSMLLVVRMEWQIPSSLHAGPETGSLIFVKFYWNITTLIHFHIVSGCFSATVAELSHCHRDLLAHKAKKTYYLGIYRKIVLIPVLGDRGLMICKVKFLFFVEFIF